MTPPVRLAFRRAALPSALALLLVACGGGGGSGSAGHGGSSAGAGGGAGTSAGGSGGAAGTSAAGATGTAGTGGTSGNAGHGGTGGAAGTGTSCGGSGSAGTGGAGTGGAPGGAGGGAGTVGAGGAGGGAGTGRGGAGGAAAGAAGAAAASGGSGGAAGAGGAAAGSGGAAAGAGGAAAGAGGAAGSGGAGGASGPALAGTAARPLLTDSSAATYTIQSYLAQAGSLSAGLTVDNWSPTGVGDVSTFVPNYTVAACGGTHSTVQAAIDAAVAAGGTNRIYIRVTAGTYREVVCIKSSAPPITLYGTEADASKTVIVNDNYAGKTVTNPITGAAPNPCASSTPPAAGNTYGTSGSATFAAYAKEFQAKNLTISNDLDELQVTGSVQAVALMTQADHLVFENVRLLGNQDTLYVKTPSTDAVDRAYFKGCYVEGDVDFIFGRGTMVLDGCEIKYLSTRRGANGGNLLAPSTDVRNNYGILVVNSMLTADSGTAAGSVGLGRAWDESQTLATYPPATPPYPNGQAVVRDSVLGAHVSNTAPWLAAATTSRPFSVTAGTYPANRLWEYANTGAGAAP